MSEHQQPALQAEGEPVQSRPQEKSADSIPLRRRIVEGTMIGVAAGIMVGLIGWLSNALQDDYKKWEQIEHMRGLVTKWGEEFYKSPDPHPHASPERIRALHFKEMEGQLRNALERRSTHVPYDRLYEIERAFGDIKKHERYGPTTGEGMSCVDLGQSKVNIDIYEDAYGKLLMALGLPESTTRQDDPSVGSKDATAPWDTCAMRTPVQVIVVEQR